MEDYKEEAIQRLRAYSRKEIIITPHAKKQAIFRGIPFDEVYENILNPQRLVFATKEGGKYRGEEKFGCYFGYSNTQCQFYALALDGKCVVVTVIKINRRWQHKIEKKAKA